MTGLAGLLERLPASLDWAVAFRLERLVAVEGEAAVRAAFGLAPGAAGEGIAHVVLTSAGPLLDRSGMLEAYTGTPPPGNGRPSLAERFSGLLDRLELEDADCVGLGEAESGSPVAMAVMLDARGDGAAEAWFASQPTGEGWELLAAVGVRPLHSPAAAGPDEPWRVRFSFSLGAHLQAARLGHFARTANCNRFFLLQGRLDPALEKGLVQAAGDRLAAAGAVAYEEALTVVETASGELMTAAGAAGRKQCGDLVPLGLLLAGIRRLPTAPRGRTERGLGAVRRLRRRLAAEAVDGGWPFQSGTVTTGLDSALVLLGLRDRAAVPALERFREPAGGYSADRAGTPGPSTVAPQPAAAHWRGPDLATTALARALRREAGLEETVPVTWLEERFDDRGSAFVACPWLLDWLLALGLAGDPAPGAARLRERLVAEVAASRSEDGSFGRAEERILATASACLVFDSLGLRGRTLALAQLALADAVRRPGPPAVPFVSTIRCDLDEQTRPAAVRALLRGRGVVAAAGDLYALTTYEDTACAVSAGLVALALSRPGDLGTPDARPVGAAAHSRYRCRSVDEYVARFGLPATLRAR